MIIRKDPAQLYHMPKFFFIVCCSLLCLAATAQKNMVAAQHTNLLELPLPPGSKQDKRFLSISAAKFVFEMETKNAGVQLVNTEVYVLPASKNYSYTTDSLSQILLRKNFRSVPIEGNNKYRWVQTNNRSFIVYFSHEKNQTDLYIAACSGSPLVAGGGAAPVNNAPVPQTTNPVTTAPVTQQVDQRLIGKWNRSSATHPHYADAASWGTAGYTTSRYEFKADGSYTYTERSFWMLHKYIILVKESGNYTVNGKELTIAPEKSVIQSYTKKNNVDELGTLVLSQNRALEKVTYTHNFHFFSGIREWNLVLQASNPTKRDGKFSGNTTFSNAWYFDQKYIDNDLTSPKGK